MPIDQILPRDGGDGRVLGLASVRIVRTVGQLLRLTANDSAHIVITTGNGVVHFFLRQIDFVGAEFGLAQQVIERLENIVEIALQARPRDGGRIGVAAGLNLGGANFEVIVELVAGLCLGSASAPDFAVNVEHADFVRGFRSAIRRGCVRCHRSIGSS